MNCGFFGIRGHPGRSSRPARTRPAIVGRDRLSATCSAHRHGRQLVV